jgi:hypothetical protein
MTSAASAPPRPPKPARSRAAAGPKPGFAPHVDAGVSPFAALAPTPGRTVSLSGTISSEIATFAAASGNGAWPHLPRAQVAARLTELVANPTRVNQAGLNACGSAVMTYLFAKRDPERFARFAMLLYERGEAVFGSIPVKGGPLKDKDPAKMAWPPGQVPPTLDWMLLSAFLRTNGNFGGEPSDDVSAITLPGELEDWLKRGIGYSSVTNEANKFFNKDLDHLRRLTPANNLDIVVLINVGVVEARSKSKGVAGAISDAVQSKFPNHWFALEAPVADNGTEIAATAWTWGQSGYVFRGTHGGWEDGYYGAIKARV